MPGTDVAVQDEQSAELVAQSDAALASIAAQQAAEYGEETLSTPILKVGQPLTKEVVDEDAEAGEFINTLSNEAVGDKVELIIAYYNRGRFASDRETERAFVAFTPDIPENWEDLVGKDFVGTPFDEYPEAEEIYKDRVNKKEIDWGHGPLVSTTHNYTAFLLVENEAGETEYQPVRLSLKRTDVPAARKINTLHRAAVGGKAPWDVVLSLSTELKQFGKNRAFIINPSDIKIVRKTTPDEKAKGAELALAVAGGRTVSEGAEDAIADTATEPKAPEGALGV